MSGYGKIKAGRKRARSSRGGAKPKVFGNVYPIKRKEAPAISSSRAKVSKFTENNNDSKMPDSDISAITNYRSTAGLNLSTATVKREGKYKLNIKYAEKCEFDLIGWSETGLNLSQSSAKPYLRLEQKVQKGQIFPPKCLGSYMRGLDIWAWDAWRTALPAIVDEWGEDMINSQPYIKGGFTDWEATTKNPNLLEVALFPHLQWTTVYEYDKKKKTTELKPMEQLLASSAISTFLGNIIYNSITVEVDPNDLSRITVTPWGTTKVLTWVNVGQDCKKAREEREKKKEEMAEERRLEKVESLVALLEEQDKPVETNGGQSTVPNRSDDEE